MSKHFNTIYQRKNSFISYAQRLHNNFYDYELVDYVNNYTKVKIICPIHGVFEQTPNSHLSGHGCSVCGLIKCANIQKDNRSNTDEFIQKAETVHGKIYNYSETKYSGAHTKIQIICPEHGGFEQRPHAHLNGQGCPTCKGGIRLTTEKFIEKATKVHNNKFDYSLVEYTNSRIRIKIICPIHGVFEQVPHDHITGRGCALCGRVGFKSNLPGLLYYIIFKYNDEYYFKIGITNRTIKERFELYDRSKIVAVRTWEYENGKDAHDEEQRILKEHKDYIYNGNNRILKYNEDNNAKHREFFIKDVLNEFEEEIEDGLEHCYFSFL